MFKHVPNLLTICRFLIIPFILLAIFQGNYIAAFVLLTISGITDIADGTIARKFNLISDFGKLMDPLADKATQIFTILALTITHVIPNSWILGILIAREFIMIVGASFLYGKEFVVSSKWYGKLSTVLIYISLVSSFAIKTFGISYRFDIYLYYIALACVIFAFVMYFITFYKNGYLKENKTDDEQKL